MKNLKLLRSVLLASLLIGLYSCQQEEEEPVYTPTEADAVAIVEEFVAQSSGGMTEEVAKLNESIQAKDLGDLDLECGVPFDTTLSYFLSGSASGSWIRNWNLLLNCPLTENPFLEVVTDYTGSFDGYWRSSDREGTRQWVWSNLGPEGEYIYLNGAGQHGGNRSFNGPNQASFSWDHEAQWTDVEIDKLTHIINSGSGTFTLTLTGPEGNTHTFNGTIIFNGDQTATVTINGEVYEVDLS